MCAVDQKRSVFPGAGPFLALLPFKEAYGKAGPLQQAPYGEGRSLREGPVLTGGSLTGMAPFPKKNDKEAYRKAEPLREAPYGEGRSLREGTVLTGSPLTGALTGRPPYGKAPYGEAPYGEASTGRPLTSYRKAYGNAYGKGLLRGGALLTGRLTYEGKSLTGKSPYGKGRS